MLIVFVIFYNILLIFRVLNKVYDDDDDGLRQARPQIQHWANYTIGNKSRRCHVFITFELILMLLLWLLRKL